MTNAEYNKLSQRADVLATRCQTLRKMETLPMFDSIISEYTEEVDRIRKITSSKREYLYNFKSGGWNSEYALTVEQAIEQAKSRWADRDGLDIDEKSFRVSTQADYQNLLSLFY
jgi:hypothetical protein